MESSGIVRRIDELGRIVIPKELRRTLRLNVGDEVEILQKEGGISLKKYSRYDEIKNVASAVAKLVANYTESDAVIVDSSKVVIAEGEHKKMIQNSNIGGEFEKTVANRRATILHGDDLKGAIDSDFDFCYLVFEPIVVDGDSYGGIALLIDRLPSDISRAYLKFCTELICVAIR